MSESEKDESAASTSGDTAVPTSKAEARSAERAARRVARATERATRAQQRADEARRAALDAVRDGGFLEDSGSEPARDATPDGGAEETSPVREPRAPEETASAEKKASGRLASRRASPVVLVALGVVAAALLGLTVYSTVEYQGARSALEVERSESAAPDQASEAARSIVTDMFTYDWKSIDAKMDQVEPRLTGEAEKEFRTSSRPAVTSAAKEQQASIFSTVAAVAPITVTDPDHVTLLVMLNRMVSTVKDPKAQSAQSRLQVAMVRVDGQWKLESLKSI